MRVTTGSRFCNDSDDSLSSCPLLLLHLSFTQLHCVYTRVLLPYLQIRVTHGSSWYAGHHGVVIDHRGGRLGLWGRCRLLRGRLWGLLLGRSGDLVPIALQGNTTLYATTVQAHNGIEPITTQIKTGKWTGPGTKVTNKIQANTEIYLIFYDSHRRLSQSEENKIKSW